MGATEVGACDGRVFDCKGRQCLHIPQVDLIVEATREDLVPFG